MLSCIKKIHNLNIIMREKLDNTHIYIYIYQSSSNKLSTSVFDRVEW